MATGRRPFEGESDYSIMAAHLQQQPLPPLQIDPRLPELLSDIILMSLAKDPGQRFQTADAFRAALGSAASQLAAAPIAAHAGPPVPQVYVPPAPPQHTARLPGQPAMGAPPQPQMRPISTHSGPQPSPTHPLQAQMRPMPPPPPPQAQPQFRPMPPPAAQPPRSHRGLYMAVGSLVTIGVLGAAAYYVPKWLKTGASGRPATQVAQATPAPQQLGSPPPTQPQPQPSVAPVTQAQGPTPQPIQKPPPTPPPIVFV